MAFQSLRNLNLPKTTERCPLGLALDEVLTASAAYTLARHIHRLLSLLADLVVNAHEWRLYLWTLASQLISFNARAVFKNHQEARSELSYVHLKFSFAPANCFHQTQSELRLETASLERSCTLQIRVDGAVSSVPFHRVISHFHTRSYRMGTSMPRPYL
jgi:hypothetical protein